MTLFQIKTKRINMIKLFRKKFNNHRTKILENYKSKFVYNYKWKEIKIQIKEIILFWSSYHSLIYA
jgi:hypothetical protein